MSVKGVVVLFVLFFGVALANDAFFVVRETDRAIVLRFGAIVEADLRPGLYFKLPVIDEVKRFDGRVLTLDAQAERFLTLEKKPLIIDAFVKWQVVNVANYYTASSGDERRAEGRLAERVRNGLRNEVSRRDMHEVVSGERDRLMQDLTQALDLEMRNEFGVAVVDVRVKRIDLPPEVSNKVYDRMASERNVLAHQYRAEGQEKAQEIRAKAEHEKVVISALAYKKAEVLRGNGDAKSTNIYAEAFNQNPEFYKFYRSLTAYAKSFQNSSDLLLIDGSSDFFQFIDSPKQQ